MVSLIVEIYAYSKDALLETLEFVLPNMQAIERMKEIRNVGIEDELGYRFVPAQISCRIRPVK